MGCLTEAKSKPVLATISAWVRGLISFNMSSGAGGVDMWFCVLVLGCFSSLKFSPQVVKQSWVSNLTEMEGLLWTPPGTLDASRRA